MKYKRDVVQSSPVIILDVIVPIGLMEYVSVNCVLCGLFSDSGEKGMEITSLKQT